MKKPWIAESAYLIVALVCIGVCIGSSKNPEKEVFGTSVTDTPEVNETKGSEETAEVTAAPVKDTIPLPENMEWITPPTGNEETAGGQNLTGIPDGDVTQSPNLPTSSEERQDSDIEPVEQPGEISGETTETGRMPGAIEILNENYESYSNDKKAWWFRRNTGHKPSGSGEEFSIGPYSAYYLDKNATDEDKVMYLTFDCGYENGFTPSILDTLAEKNVKAMFFVTKDFIVKNPAYVKRMKDEGHLVGNHTVRHLSSPDLTPEELAEELYEVARVMETETGYKLDPFFRPPMGEYSERSLKATQDMGYSSVFWSIAYYDYDVNNQPGKEYVVDHFATYHHNGSIVLMHNISESNAQALEDVIDGLKAEGYRLGTLMELEK